MPTTPHQSCFALLKRILEIKQQILDELKEHPKHHTITATDPLTLAMALYQARAEDLSENNKELRNYFLAESTFGREKVWLLLSELLDADTHLTKSCRTTVGLSRAIAVVGQNAPALLRVLKSVGQADNVVADVLNGLFECEYQREVFIHIYNLQLPSGSLRLQAIEAEIVQVAVTDIPKLTGEATYVSSLHDVRTGNCFLRFADNQAGDEAKAFEDCWTTATRVAATMKYVEYGIIDLDYGVIHYRPEWVNEVLRFGIPMWGLPRRDQQIKAYILEGATRETFERYWLAVQKLKPVLEDMKPTLREAIALSGDYYEAHHGRQSNLEKLIGLVIALEAMFSPGKEGEHRFRIAQRAAILLGQTSQERETIAKFIRRVYDARSKLVHTGKNPFSGGDNSLKEEEIPLLGDYIRKAILRLFALLVRGYKEKQEIDALLDGSALDTSLLERLRKESDYEQMIREM